jgi:hypothetical protein
VLWWVRWAAGADEEELRVIASVGEDVRRLLRAARFEACATTWHQARLAMNQVIRLGEIVPWAEPFLRAAARRVVALPGVPPPPLHAYASPGVVRPGEGELPHLAALEPIQGAPVSSTAVSPAAASFVAVSSAAAPAHVAPVLGEGPLSSPEEDPVSSGEPLGTDELGGEKLLA